jgi:hypothetical protein
LQPRQVRFLTACSGLSGAKPVGCGREAAGDPGPWRQQAVLGRSLWNADVLRDIVRAYTLATLTAPDAVLVVDETGFLKQKASRCRPTVYGFCGQDHQLSDRRIWRLCVPVRPCPDRVGALSAQGLEAAMIERA